MCAYDPLCHPAPRDAAPPRIRKHRSAYRRPVLQHLYVGIVAAPMDGTPACLSSRTPSGPERAPRRLHGLSFVFTF